MAENRTAEAIDHYADAITRDSQFFYNHLQVGLAHLKRNERDSAETHLDASVDLFATADARHALGTLAEAQGDLQGAIEHYNIASSSDNAAGRTAQGAMVRLDLPQNPGRYLQVATATDAQGQLIVQISNPTGVTVANLGMAVRFYDSQGTVRETNRVMNQALQPGQRVQLATGLGPFSSANSYQVELQNARIITD